MESTRHFLDTVNLSEWLGMEIIGYCGHTDVGGDGRGWNADQLTFWFVLNMPPVFCLHESAVLGRVVCWSSP